MPGYIRNSQSWQFITAIEDELKVISTSNNKFSEYLRKIKKLIEDIKKEYRSEMASSTPLARGSQKSKTVSPSRTLTNKRVTTNNRTGPKSIGSDAFLFSRRSRSHIRLLEVGEESESKTQSPFKIGEGLN